MAFWWYLPLKVCFFESCTTKIRIFINYSLFIDLFHNHGDVPFSYLWMKIHKTQKLIFPIWGSHFLFFFATIVKIYYFWR